MVQGMVAIVYIFRICGYHTTVIILCRAYNFICSNMTTSIITVALLFDNCLFHVGGYIESVSCNKSFCKLITLEVFSVSSCANGSLIILYTIVT